MQAQTEQRNSRTRYPFDLDFYARLFLRLGREASIASPAELIALLRREAHAILSLYPG